MNAIRFIFVECAFVRCVKFPSIGRRRTRQCAKISVTWWMANWIVSNSEELKTKRASRKYEINGHFRWENHLEQSRESHDTTQQSIMHVYNMKWGGPVYEDRSYRTICLAWTLSYHLHIASHRRRRRRTVVFVRCFSICRRVPSPDVFDVARQFPLNRFSMRFISILEIVFRSHPISQSVVVFAIMSRFGLSVSRSW